MNNNKIKTFLSNNIVPIVFIVLIGLAIPLTGFSADYLIQQIISRLVRNSFLVLALLIPVIAGMGLNFAIVLGAMAGQFGLIMFTNYGITGFEGFFLAMILSIPISIGLGIFGGHVLNRAKGKEMITSLILGYFMTGVYQIIVLFTLGKLIPITNNKILLPRGYGIRNAIDLLGIRQVMDRFGSFSIGNIDIPVGTFILIALLCLFIVWFRRTKLGQDMRAIGQDPEIAKASGIAVDKTRVIAIVISTVLAGLGQIIYLQNIGTMNTYNSHEQIGLFSVAAILVGGASVKRASIPNAIVGVILFHMMFIVSPRAGKELFGDAQIGEYFRSFVAYGVIAVALALYEWRRNKEKRDRIRKLYDPKDKKTQNINCPAREVG